MTRSDQHCKAVERPGFDSSSSRGTGGEPRLSRHHEGRNQMLLLLWILAVILVISGIVAILRGQILWGIVLIIVGLLVGPGGVSIFRDDNNNAGAVPAAAAPAAVIVQR